MFRFSFIVSITIISEAIYMKIRIVHMLRADWLEDVSIMTYIYIYRVTVLGTYMTSRYILIT